MWNQTKKKNCNFYYGDVFFQIKILLYKHCIAIALQFAISSQTTDLTRQFTEKFWRISCNISKDFLLSVTTQPKIIWVFLKYGEERGGGGGFRQSYVLEIKKEKIMYYENGAFYLYIFPFLFSLHLYVYEIRFLIHSYFQSC